MKYGRASSAEGATSGARAGLHRSVSRSARAAILGLLLAALPITGAQAQEHPTNGVIAFAAERAGTRVIYTRAPNGTRLRLIRTGSPADHPAFTPRGKRLLFSRRGDAGSQVWIAYLDGTGLRP